MAARIRELIHLRSRDNASHAVVVMRHRLIRKLYQCRPYDGEKAMSWFIWRNACRIGLANAPIWLLTYAAHEMVGTARDMERGAARARGREFRKWVAAAPGEVAVYRWMQEKPPFIPHPIVIEDGKPVMLAYNEMLTKRATTFTSIWQDNTVELLGDWKEMTRTGNKDPLRIPEVHEIRKCSRSFRIGTSHGSDVLHPRHFDLLSDSLIQAFIKLWTNILDLGALPDEIATILIKLIPKSSGADRPIGLFTSFVRIYMRWFRRSTGAQWMSMHVPSNWYGVKDKSVNQAAWARLVAARFARETGQTAIAALFDVTKCYDNIRLNVAVPVMIRMGFPCKMLRIITRLYQAKRFVIVDGSVAATARPTKSTVRDARLLTFSCLPP